MSHLKRLIVEIHRRSLWQVMAIYLGASWGVLEASDQVIGQYLLPQWVYPTEILVLLVGLPLVLATAFVREEHGPTAPSAPESSTPTGQEGDPTAELAEPGGDRVSAKPAAETVRSEPGGAAFFARQLTLPRVVLALLGSLAIVGVASAFVVIRGAGRVTESRGTAGDAFENRAWLVVTEVEAAPEDRDVALAAREALTVDLQQSRYVNVYSREQLNPVLQRMGLPDTTRLDRAVALEVAEREGLAAVLAVTVSRLGGQYVLSARVVQPGSGEEIVAVRTAAAEDRLLDGVEKLSHEVRHRLGERQEAIRQSEPLPKVTTRSLEALKLYAQATEANRRYNFEQAYELVTQAIRLDSTFAAAYRAAAVYSGNRGHLAEAVRYAARAYELRDGLTERERLLTEATYYAHVEMDFRRAVNAYEVMLSRYPDWGTAALNLAVYAAVALGERERAYQASLRAVELAPYSALAYGQVIANARWTDRWEIADSVIQVAREVGFEEQAADWSLGQALGRREWARADFLCDSLLVASTAAPRTANLRARCGILDIARGRMQRGIERELAVVAYRTESGDRYLSGSPFLNALLAEAMRGHDAAARALFEQGFAVIEPETMAEPERFFSRQTVQVIAYLLEMPDMAETMEEIIPPFPDSEHPVSRMGQLLTEAARALYEGESERTVELLRRMRAIGYAGGWVPFADLMSGLAFERLGEPDSAVAYLERVIEPVRLAGWAFCRLQLPMIELRLARLEESRGDVEAAIRHYRHFLELWAEPDPELQDEVETARRAVARLADRETI